MKACVFELELDLPDEIDCNDFSRWIMNQITWMQYGAPISDEQNQLIEFARDSDEVADSIVCSCKREWPIEPNNQE